MTEKTEYPWCKHGINKTGYCADCKVYSLITTIESLQKESKDLTEALDDYAAIISSYKYEIESQKEEIEILKSSLQSIKEHSSDRASAAAASSALKMASRIQEGDK